MTKPTQEAQITVYCHNGCNQSQVPLSDGYDECAACGSIMRPEYSNDYDASISYSVGEPNG